MQNSEKSMRPKNGRRPAAGQTWRSCPVRPGERTETGVKFAARRSNP